MPFIFCVWQQRWENWQFYSGHGNGNCNGIGHTDRQVGVKFFCFPKKGLNFTSRKWRLFEWIFRPPKWKQKKKKRETDVCEFHNRFHPMSSFFIWCGFGSDPQKRNQHTLEDKPKHQRKRYCITATKASRDNHPRTTKTVDASQKPHRLDSVRLPSCKPSSTASSTQKNFDV